MQKIWRAHLIVWAVSLTLIAGGLALARAGAQDRPGWVLYTVDPSGQSNNPMQIFRLPDNGGAAELLNEQFIKVVSPRWSPDGAWIAFLAAGDTSQPNPSRNFWPTVYRMRADGSGLQQVVQLRERPLSGGQLAWSADGQRVIFSVDVGATSMIYRIAADGRHAEQWTLADPDDAHSGLWVSVDDPTAAPHADSAGDKARLSAALAGIPFNSDQAADTPRWTAAVPYQAMDQVVRLPLGADGYPLADVEPEVIFQTKGLIAGPALFWSPDGTEAWFAVVREHDRFAASTARGTDLYRLNLASGAVEVVLSNDGGGLSPVAWLGAADTLLVQATFNEMRVADLYRLPRSGAASTVLSALPAVSTDGIVKANFDWSPPAGRSFQWGLPFAAGIAGFLWGCGLWVRALVRLRRAVGTLRLPARQLVLAGASYA